MKKVFIIIIGLAIGAFANHTMSQKIFNVLNIAEKLSEQNKGKEFLALLKKIEKRNLNKYEKSYILQTRANYYLSKNKYKEAGKQYEQIISINVFKRQNIERMKLSLARIYLYSQEYKKSIKLLNSLKNSKYITKEILYENLILATYYSKDYLLSIKYSEKYFSLVQAPQESFYKILYSSYVEIKDYDNAISTLKIMIKKWSNNEIYWVQLASLYEKKGELKNTLAILDIANKENILKSPDNILYFISILHQSKIYCKAAIVLEKGLIKKSKRNFELLLSSYFNSKQNAKFVKLLDTSSFAKEAKYQLILASIYYKKQKFENSIKVLKQIKVKPELSEYGEKNIQLALNYYAKDKKSECIKYLELAYKNSFSKKRAYNLLVQLDPKRKI